MAHRQGKSLNQLFSWIEPMTYRQYLAWREWYAMQESVPDRSDKYQMQLAMQLEKIHQLLASRWVENFKPTKLSIEDFAIKYGEREPYKEPEKKPGKIPYTEGEWWPHPLTKEEVQAGLTSMKLAQHGVSRNDERGRAGKIGGKVRR